MSNKSEFYLQAEYVNSQNMYDLQSEYINRQDGYSLQPGQIKNEWTVYSLDIWVCVMDVDFGYILSKLIPFLYIGYILEY